MQMMRSPIASTIRRLLGQRVPTGDTSTEMLHEDLLYNAGRTKSMDELLRVFPQKIRDAFGLASFDVFLQKGKEYVLQRAVEAGDGATADSLPAYCSTVTHLKRERRPATFVPEGTETDKVQPDAWQVLATPREIELMLALGTQLLLPLEGRTGLIGLVSLGRGKGSSFTKQEMEFFSSLGAQMGRGLETAQLIHSLEEEAAKRAKAARELELAREVQERLLPVQLPVFPGLDVAASYKSAEEVGGDYYDLFVTDGGLLCGVMADISGKGIAAALLMATLRASLHTLTLIKGQKPEEMIEQLGRLLFKASSMSRYATLFFFLYDGKTGEISYVNAGHNPPMLLEPDGTVQRLTCGGPVIGLFADAEYEHGVMPLGEGASLILYTDGVTEGANATEAEWGEEGLLGILGGPAAGTAKELMGRILQAHGEFTAGCPQGDDITLMVLRRSR